MSFSFLIDAARISNSMLNRSGESEHPCLFSYVPFIPTLVRVFIVNGCIVQMLLLHLLR